MRVRFTPSARTEFLSAIRYIHERNPAAAYEFRHHAAQVLSRLEQFPEAGRVLPEFPELPYREVIVRPYRFFYRSIGDTVWITAVWHGAQLPEEPPTI
jgi:toxin ParE1/3/4